MKPGMYVVSKGKDKPWIYRIKSIDTRVNCAYLQFVGHGKKLRKDVNFIQRDKWRSLAELVQATPDQLQEALANPGENFHSMSKRVMALASALERTRSPQPYVPNCQHEWREYQGFRWDYKYCVKCDAKQGGDDK